MRTEGGWRPPPARGSREGGGELLPRAGQAPEQLLPSLEAPAPRRLVLLRAAAGSPGEMREGEGRERRTLEREGRQNETRKERGPEEQWKIKRRAGWF